MVCSVGCTSLRLPSLAVLTQNPMERMLADKTPASSYEDASGVPTTYSSEAERVYYRTRQAMNQGGMVLHIAGDENPVRVLPLPGDGRSVYVSQLLKQTGVVEKLGKVNVTLFRYSPQSINGLPMECRMNSGKSIKPESDYALQPGDRVRITKDTSGGLDDLVGMVLRR